MPPRWSCVVNFLPSTCSPVARSHTKTFMSAPAAAKNFSSGENLTCATSPMMPKRLYTARRSTRSHTMAMASPAGAFGERAWPEAAKRPEADTSRQVTSASWPRRKVCACGSSTSASTRHAPSAVA